MEINPKGNAGDSLSFTPKEEGSQIQDPAELKKFDGFNEVTTAHNHGVDVVDTSGGKTNVFVTWNERYFEGKSIEIQQDNAPQGARPYSVIDLARNPRDYVSTNPGSPSYDGSYTEPPTDETSTFNKDRKP